MKFQAKIIFLLVLTLLAILVTAILRPIPQDPSFHLFADTRSMLGIPNFLNVITNLPFLFIGCYGLSQLKKLGADSSTKLIYGTLFMGILITGLGSAYYHYSPNNDTLVWDRIPMTIVFMSFFCATISELVNARAGAVLLLPLVILGISSVWWWHYSEINRHGDLRFYGFIQYYPMVFIPLIMILFPSKVSRKQLRFLALVVVWYVLAKAFEYFDKDIHHLSGLISGHSLKHLAAAVATWYIVRIFSSSYGSLKDKSHALRN